MRSSEAQPVSSTDKRHLQTTYLGFAVSDAFLCPANLPCHRLHNDRGVFSICLLIPVSASLQRLYVRSSAATYVQARSQA